MGFNLELRLSPCSVYWAIKSKIKFVYSKLMEGDCLKERARRHKWLSVAVLSEWKCA